MAIGGRLAVRNVSTTMRQPIAAIKEARQCGREPALEPPGFFHADPTFLTRLVGLRRGLLDPPYVTSDHRNGKLFRDDFLVSKE